jgi:metal-responsive CopG/Arc/MetJ family transcriptional regulator
MLMMCVYHLGMERLQMFIPAPMLKALKALAKKRDVSVAELIRRAVEDYLRKEQQ